MPTYQARCECGNSFEYVSRVATCDLVPDCDQCGKPAQKVILSAPYGVVFGRFDTFQSPVDRSVIRTARELTEHNKRNNVVSLHDGYTEERIKKGDYIKPHAFDKKERKKDVAEAIHMVRNGYKPEIRSADNAIG